MKNGILYVPFHGTIKLLNEFQEQVGIARHQDALSSVLFLNRTMVEDARQGLIYSVSDNPGARVNLAELYEAHIEKVRGDRCRDVMTYLRGVDPVGLNAVRQFMEEKHLDVGKPAEVLTVAVSMAQATYGVFGSGKTGYLNIPTLYPDRPWETRRRHIHLKIS